MSIIELAETGSTNDWLAERRSDLADGSWVRADVQTGGRGRRGRAWTSLPGNLFASVLVRSQPGEGPAQQLSFVAAVALHEALRGWVPNQRLALKWPNDVLLDGVKVSGILLEGQGDATIIGFGVNLADHPVDSERPATSLAASGLAFPSATVFCATLAASFAAVRAEWQASGFDTVRTAWLTRAGGLGQPLIARLGDVTVQGCFEGLADDGAVQLRLADGSVRLIHAGEVFGMAATC